MLVESFPVSCIKHLTVRGFQHVNRRGERTVEDRSSTAGVREVGWDYREIAVGFPGHRFFAVPSDLNDFEVRILIKPLDAARPLRPTQAGLASAVRSLGLSLFRGRIAKLSRQHLCSPSNL